MIKILKLTLATIFALFSIATSSARVWHVDCANGSVENDGSKSAPLNTISKAAYLAIAGDTVLIHGGVYREWVSPANAGLSAERPIVYMAAEGELVELKGSEVVEGWMRIGKMGAGIWRKEVDNSIFGTFNPFDINLFGDWLHKGSEFHLGEVYLNGVALEEVLTEAEVGEGKSKWYASVKGDKTTLYVNFGDNDPSKNLVEINVRPTCFFPQSTGINYVVVKGLKISQAATQWAAPTNDQIGIIGPHWSKGWVIEDCDISNSKCVGICLGKDRASGHNKWSLYKGNFGYRKHGFNQEIESVLAAYDLGWSRENIGSHTIRNNRIYNCGQAGIVGHMGCSFSHIVHNEIFNINITSLPRMDGFETAGIKLHAAIDTFIEGNVIHDASMALWLDWQAQCAQVFNNVMFRNEKQDIFIEVSHGPTMVYNNILLSSISLFVDAQGVAYFNNLIGGTVLLRTSSPRYTPYHKAHSTKIKGLFNNTGGDVRFYNNIFLATESSKKGRYGTASYNDYPLYKDDMNTELKTLNDYLSIKLPIWTSGNLFYAGTARYVNEQNYTTIERKADRVEVVQDGSSYYIKNLPPLDDLSKVSTVGVSSYMLGSAMISEERFENPDGGKFTLKSDIYGEPRNIISPMVGPFESYKDGPIWK